MHKKQNTARRHLVLSLLFALVCLVFVARLVNLQFDKEKTEQLRAESEYTIETEVIQALRGNICDRNGKVLVSTSYSYDIIFDYTYMPDGVIDFNTSILRVLSALDETKSNIYRTSDLFPFAGEYPSYTYSTEALREGSATNKALNKNY